MLNEVKFLLSSGNLKELHDISSSLRTTLSQKLRDLDFSVLLETGAVKRHVDAEKMLPSNFYGYYSKDKSIVALR